MMYFRAMKSLFDPAESKIIIERINSLNPQSQPLWGKMNVSQMLAHSQKTLKLALGKETIKRSFIGFLFGGIAKKQLLKPEPFKKNLPTAPEFVIVDKTDFETEKRNLINLVEEFTQGGPSALSKNPHPFFGKLSVEEWNLSNWKHLDHHLRQFGA